MESNNKLKALVHYVCHNCKNPNKLGATKLNKILWFADSLFYKEFGKSITESQYKKLQHGPVPKSMTFVLDDLQASKKISIEEHKVINFSQKKFISLSQPDISMFSDEELGFVDYLISAICDEHTATSISNLSHGLIWQAAGMGEEIPIEAVLAEDEGVLNAEDIQWADSIIREKLVSAF